MRKTSRTVRRFPRVRVPNQEQVVIASGSKKTVGRLTKLSLAGGLVHMPSRPAEPFAAITINTLSGPVNAPIQFLSTAPPGERDAIAFRFVGLQASHQQRLQKALTQLRREGYGEQQNLLSVLLRRTLRACTPSR